MNNKILFVITWSLVFLTSCISSKNEKTSENFTKCTLVFRAPQEEITVYVSKPIDDTYNYYISDKLNVIPNISIYYELDVNDFGFVRCRFSNGLWRHFLVFPGDCIEISCEPQKINISGNNAEGHNYINDNYVDRGLGYYHNIIERQISSPINYDSIYFFLEQLLLTYQTDLKKMETSGSITHKFSSLLAKNLYFGLIDALPSIYSTWVVHKRENFLIQNFEPFEEDVQNMLQQLEQLYDTPCAMGDDAKKMPYRFISDFLLKYHCLDDNTKEKLMEGYEKDCFGHYPYLLLASDSLQLRFYSTLLIGELQNGTRYFNHEGLLAYLSKKFPNSEYVSIIREMMVQTQQLGANKEIVITDESPVSIKDMMQLPGIKGNYAYVDLWATWCMPCTNEFKYNDDVHNLLAQYNNIVPIYISIDTNRKTWENRVNKFNLKGYNIMASKSLNEDIGVKVYHEEKIGFIPRYLLLDPAGNIVNDSLPRPSQSTLLKPILNSVLK